jgi:hypothetical protein
MALEISQATAITASQVVYIQHWADLGYAIGYANNRLTIGIPANMILSPSTIIASLVLDLQATDTLTAIQIYARTWAMPAA